MNLAIIIARAKPSIEDILIELLKIIVVCYSVKMVCSSLSEQVYVFITIQQLILYSI
jgi:hypothetical protein